MCSVEHGLEGIILNMGKTVMKLLQYLPQTLIFPCDSYTTSLSIICSEHLSIFGFARLNIIYFLLCLINKLNHWRCILTNIYFCININVWFPGVLSLPSLKLCMLIIANVHWVLVLSACDVVSHLMLIKPFELLLYPFYGCWSWGLER